MQVRRFSVALACSLLLTLAASPPAMAASDVDVARQTLAANDGWGAATSGTTGGAAADAAHVFVVTNRAQFIAALNNVFALTGVTPDRIITRFNGTQVHEVNNVVNGSIWNVARSGAEIAADFNDQFVTAPAGLVANWRLDEPSGSVAVDHAGDHDAAVSAGASFSPLTHP